MRPVVAARGVHGAVDQQVDHEQLLRGQLYRDGMGEGGEQRVAEWCLW